jgi:putative FmdB family regulatory protein
MCLAHVRLFHVRYSSFQQSGTTAWDNGLGQQSGTTTACSATITRSKMPIYDYKCRTCGVQFELLILGSRVAACTSCESLDLEQLLSTGIAVSSASIRQSNIDAARRRLKNSSNYRDKKVAEMEEIKEHSPVLPENKKNP